MAKKDDVIALAKSGKATAKKPAARKPAARKTTPKRKAPVKKVEPELTPEQIRDQKAKDTVEKLLQDSPIVTLEKKDELLELDEDPTPEEPKGVEWLEEQLTLLTEKNKALTAENEVIKIENEQLRGGMVVQPSDGDAEVKATVVRLFDELQTQLINRGINPRTQQPNFEIRPVGFLNRMITFFPFLAPMKRFR